MTRHPMGHKGFLAANAFTEPDLAINGSRISNLRNPKMSKAWVKHIHPYRGRCLQRHRGFIPACHQVTLALHEFRICLPPAPPPNYRWPMSARCSPPQGGSILWCGEKNAEHEGARALCHSELRVREQRQLRDLRGFGLVHDVQENGCVMRWGGGYR